MSRLDEKLRARLLAKVVRTPSGCLLWIAAKDKDGYGKLHVRALGGVQKAHRLAYELFVGPIPDGLTIDHLCRNRGCINHEHLEPVTQGDNVRRMAAARRAEREAVAA